MTQVLSSAGDIHSQVPSRQRKAKSRATRRAGYVATVLVDGAMLWVVNHLLEWGWPPLLTKAFEDLLPWVSLSFVAAIAVNVLWTWRDPAWFRHVGQLGLNAITLAVIVRSWQIFPFDFTGYWSGWESLARIALSIAFIGVVIDTVTRIVALTRAAHRPVGSSPGRSRSRDSQIFSARRGACRSRTS